MAKPKSPTPPTLTDTPAPDPEEKSLLYRALNVPILGALLFVTLFVLVWTLLFVTSRRYLLTVAFLGAVLFAFLGVVEPHDAFYWVWPVLSLNYIVAWFFFDHYTRLRRSK